MIDIIYILFFILMSCLFVTDLFYRRIPNIIVLPGIVIGIYLTGNWIWALVMCCIGTCDYALQLQKGGDVKLLIMMGAFMGWLAIPAFLVAILFNRWIFQILIITNIYKNILNRFPFATTLTAGSFLVMATIWIPKCLG